MTAAAVSGTSCAISFLDADRYWLINLEVYVVAMTVQTVLLLNDRSTCYSTELLTVKSFSHACERSLWTDVAIVLNIHGVTSCVSEAC